MIQEKRYDYDPSIIREYHTAYFIGYWQSEKYFIDIREILLNELKLKAECPGNNETLLNEMAYSNSIAIHYRRLHGVSKGVNVKISRDFHGVINEEYYRLAIEYLETIIPDPRYFVFSDDIGWAKENIGLTNNVHFIDNRQLPNSDMEDFRLMTACKYFIIANSSFSWWGAWLSNQKRKIVVAPKRWFTSQDINLGDLFPPTWHLL